MNYSNVEMMMTVAIVSERTPTPKQAKPVQNLNINNSLLHFFVMGMVMDLDAIERIHELAVMDNKLFSSLVYHRAVIAAWLAHLHVDELIPLSTGDKPVTNSLRLS
jgi:hypothetical protein